MTEQRQPWEQMEGEPDMWFTRFEMYKQLGPNRSLRLLNGLLHGMDGPSAHVGSATRKYSKRWDWVKRAQAWDKEQVLAIGVVEFDRRLDAREERLAIIERVLRAVATVLDTADIGSMGRHEARAWIPTMRLMLKDLLAAQRAELGGVNYGEVSEPGLADFRAEEFIAASEELAAWSKAQKKLEGLPAD